MIFSGRVDFRKQFDVKSVYDDEIEIESYALQPNMRLTRDLVNIRGSIYHILAKYSVKMLTFI